MRCLCPSPLLRRFYWHELMLWPKDIPAHAIVALSANDDLVPAELVQVLAYECSNIASWFNNASRRPISWLLPSLHHIINATTFTRVSLIPAGARCAFEAGICAGSTAHVRPLCSSKGVLAAQGQLRKARSPAKVLVHPTAGHGGFIADPAYQQHVVDEFASLLLACEGRL